MANYYRIVQNDPPTLDDFRSYADLGVTYDASTAEARRLAEGISVTVTVAQARARVRSGRVAGAYVAELVVPPDAPIVAERTGRQRGHHTLWGDPAAFLECVTSVVRADAVD